MLLPFDKALASAGSLLTVGVTVTARPARQAWRHRSPERPGRCASRVIMAQGEGEDLVASVVDKICEAILGGGAGRRRVPRTSPRSAAEPPSSTWNWSSALAHPY